jgi:hypothetical protein
VIGFFNQPWANLCFPLRKRNFSNFSNLPRRIYPTILVSYWDKNIKNVDIFFRGNYFRLMKNIDKHSRSAGYWHWLPDIGTGCHVLAVDIHNKITRYFREFRIA